MNRLPKGPGIGKRLALNGLLIGESERGVHLATECNSWLADVLRTEWMHSVHLSTQTHTHCCPTSPLTEEQEVASKIARELTADLTSTQIVKLCSILDKHAVSAELVCCSSEEDRVPYAGKLLKHSNNNQEEKRKSDADKETETDKGNADGEDENGDEIEDENDEAF